MNSLTKNEEVIVVGTVLQLNLEAMSACGNGEIKLPAKIMAS